MLDVKSLSPLPVATIVWQPSRGSFAATVICKATFDLAPSISTLAQTQEPLREDDEHFGRDPAHSLYAPTDGVPVKPRADVLLVGHAYAPRGSTVGSLIARLVVGEVNKSIEITPERAFTREGSIREGARFAKMPLHYERAAAGPDNPVGVRLDAPNTYGVVSLPNLLPPGLVVNAPTDSIPPVSFGPIAPAWRQRAQKLGPQATGFTLRDFSQRPLPDGFDLSFFNAAPRDQQIDTIRPDERIVLENLHPTIPRFVTSLPGIWPRAFVELSGRNVQELTLMGDTLWIDTDRSVCTVVWRGHCPIEFPTQTGRVVVVLGRAGDNLAWADIEKLDRGARRPDGTPNATFDLDEDEDFRQTTLAADAQSGRIRAALPFARDAAPPAAPPAPPLGRLASPAASSGPISAPAPAPVSAPAAVPMPAPVPVPAPAPVPLAAPSVVSAAPPVSPWAARDSAAGPRPSPIVATHAPTPAPAPAAPVPATPPPVPAKPVEPSKPLLREYLDLLWYDADSVRRMRSVKAWTKARTEPEDGDFIDGSSPWKPAAGATDRLDVLRILTGVKPLSGEEILSTSAGAVDESGAFAPALVVTSGELQLTFDEIESLKAYITAANPIATADKRLKEAVDAAAEALKSSWPPSAPLAETFTVRIKEAFAQANRAVPAHYLEAAAERALLGQRLFQKRTILGKSRLRCLFTPSQGGSPIPVYLPESLGTQLPMFQRFRATLIAETQGQQDQYETHPIALLVLALGRLLPVPGSTAPNPDKARGAGGR